MTNNKATALLIVVSAVWGFGYVLTQFALDEGWTPLQIIAGRFIIGGLILWMVFYKAARGITKKEIRYGTITGLFLLGGFTFQTVGQIYSTPAIAGFLTTVNIVMIPFIDWGLFKVKPDPYILVAVAITFAGVALISLTDSMTMTVGILIILVGTTFYGVQLCTLGHFVKSADPVGTTLVMTAVTAAGALVLAVITSAAGHSLPVMNFKGIGSVVFLGVFSTALCFMGQSVAIKYMASSKAGVILSTECVFGAVVSVLLYKEVLRIQTVIGCGAIFLAVVLTETQFRFLKRKEI